MGSSTAKTMRALMAAVLAVCLAISMVPALALAQASGTVTGPADGTQANTTVQVETVDSFAITEVSVWSTALSIADSRSDAFTFADDKVSAGAGVMWAAFQRGRAKDWDGTSGHFDATWTWERAVQNANGDTVTTAGDPIKTTVNISGNQTDMAVASLTMNEMFAAQGWMADAQRPGTYTVKLLVEGSNCSAEHTFQFTIVNADEVLDQLTDADDNVTIWGAFSLTSQLDAVNLKTATSSEQQAIMDGFTAAAAGKTVGAAYQLSIVNGGLFYDETPSFVQESVQFPIGSDLMGAIADHEDLTVLKNTGNAVVQDVYKYDEAAGVYKKVQDDGSLSSTDTLAITAQGNGGLMKLNMAFTSANIGAIALAWAPTTHYTVEVSLEGAGSGSVSPTAETTSYGAGAQPAYTFYAATGSVLSGISVLSGGAPYPADKYELTSDTVRFKGLDADVRIVATFDEYKLPGGEDPDQSAQPLTLSVQQQGATGGTVTASYTQLIAGSGGTYTKVDATSSTFPLTDVAAGSQVRLDISAPEGYVIDGVWMFGSDVAEADRLTDAHKVSVKGSTVVIPTMTSDTTNMVVRYVAGEKPPVVTHTLNAFVDGDPTAGSFADMNAAGTGRYTTTMTQGDYQVVKVVANQGWAISRVVLFQGLQTSTGGRTLMTATADDGIDTFSHTIYPVEGDCSVVAAFVKVESSGDDPIVIPDPEKTYTVTAKVNGTGGTISPSGTQEVRAGSDQTFTVTPNAGYVVKSVTANGHTVGLTQHESGYSYFTAYSISGNMTIVATFEQSATAPDITEQPIAVTVKSVGLGRAYPTGASRVASGQPFTVTLEPNSECALKSLTVNGRDVTAGVDHLAYTIPSVTETTEIIATFVDKNGSTIGGGSQGGVGDDDDIFIDVDIDIDVEIETYSTFARSRAAVVEDVIGGEVTPIHVKLKPGMTQEFIIKPFNGSYVYQPITATGASIIKEGPIPMGEVQPSPDGVNMPYYSVTLGDFTSTSVKLNVKFASCYKDPENTSGVRYIYDQAAGRIVDVTPSTDGDVSVEYPGNNSEGVAGDVIDATVRPDGSDPIDRIEILDHTIDIERDENGNIVKVIVDKDSTDPNFPPKEFVVNPVGDPNAEKKALDDATEELNKRIDAALGYEPPRNQGQDGRPDYVKPGESSDGKFDGSFDLQIPTVDSKGDPIDPDVNVSTEGNQSVLYQYMVNLGFAEDSEIEGGLVWVERNGESLGELETAGRTVPMNHEGALVLHATPNAGYSVQFIVKDGEDNIQASDENIVSLAALDAEGSGEMSKSYIVTGPGTVYAQFYRTGSSDSSSSSSSSGGSSAGSSSSSSSSSGTSSGDGSGSGNDGAPDGSLGNADVQAGTAYAVTASADGRGTISPSGTNYYRVNSSAAFNLIPKTGYQVTAIIVDGKRQMYTSTKYTMTPQAGGTTHTLVAEFSPVVPAAGTTTTGSKAIRTLQSLASTGDGQAAIALTLAGVVCAAVGVGLLSSNRRRRTRTAEAAADKA